MGTTRSNRGKPRLRLVSKGEISLPGGNSLAPYDARRVANLFIAQAKKLQIGITHLALQKLLYFAHGTYLQTRSTPLVEDYFEAWPYGPVHPCVYYSLRGRRGNIVKPAKYFDISTEKEISLSPIIGDHGLEKLVKNMLEDYKGKSAWFLVWLSHKRGAPWEVAMQPAMKRRVGDGKKAHEYKFYGMTIPNNLIEKTFIKHYNPVEEFPGRPEGSGKLPNEDTEKAEGEQIGGVGW